jgi:hypothetical protein
MFSDSILVVDKFERPDINLTPQKVHPSISCSISAPQFLHFIDIYLD